MNWIPGKIEIVNEGYCFCGRGAVKKINDIPLCKHHDAPKKVINKKGRFSGKSNSPNAFNEYK